jgi:hypothetical protein
MDRDVLSTIPGATLTAALLSLPDAASSDENTLRRTVDLAEGLRAEVTFARLKSPYIKKRPTSGRWFWTPASAVIIGDEQP